MDCYCDYDAPEAYSSQMRKARKPHKCMECSGTIQLAERYEHHWGKMEGSIYYGKTCVRCVAIREWVKGNVPCFCWAHGNLDSDMEGAVMDAYDRAPEEVIGLRFGLVRRLKTRDDFNYRQTATR